MSAMHNTTPDVSTLRPSLDRLGQRALLAGVVGLAVCLVGVLFGTHRAWEGYLYGFLFWTNLSIGCLALVLLHHLVGGGWGFAIQRLLEAGASLLVVMALLFLPMWAGLDDLYIWARPEEVARDPMLQHKSPYLNPSFFMLRSIVYFAVWAGLATVTNRWSHALDRPGNAWRVGRLESIAGPGLVAVILCVTFYSFDWVMSLEPHWYSTIYGFLFLIGQALSAMAFSAIVLRQLVQYKPLSEVVTKQQFHDVGNLLLAFTMLWTYVSLSQFLITWSGNLPEEVPWYLRRSDGGWQLVSVILVVFHFVIPFLLLLGRENKRQIRTLAVIAGWIFAMRAVELVWLVMPGLPHAGFVTLLWFVAGFVGVGGLWLALFVRRIQSRPLLPLHDPRLDEAFGHHE